MLSIMDDGSLKSAKTMSRMDDIVAK